LARSTRRIALLALAGLAACSESRPNTAPPLDRFYYPTGIALTKIANDHTGLVVLSSNFDLRYDAGDGGTVLVVDVEATLAGAPSDRGSPAALAVVGSSRVGSFGGQVAILDSTSCSTWGGRATRILATSRSQNALYAIDMAPEGTLACDPSSAPCKVPLESTLGDPFGIAVACGSFPEPVGTTEQEGFVSEPPRAYAFVTYGQSANLEGWLSRLDMLAGDPSATRKRLDLGLSQGYAAVFDQNSARLYVTSRFASVGFNPLRWFGVATPRLDAELAPLGPSTLDVGAVVRGSDSRGMAISSDGTRAYLALRMYDVDDATSFGGRPSADVSGALAVIDLREQPQGGPAARVLRVVPLDRGPTEVKVIHRDGQRDLVAITSTDDAALTLYDDEVGEIARVFGLFGRCDSESDNANAPPPCDPGKPLLGKQPFGLAVQPLTPTASQARLFVGSFDRSWVNVIDIDPSRPQAAPSAWTRIGPERP